MGGYELLRPTNYSLRGGAEEITLQDFFQFTRVNEYFRAGARQRRYTVIDSAVHGDEPLSQLWKLLQERFQEEMG